MDVLAGRIAAACIQGLRLILLVLVAAATATAHEAVERDYDIPAQPLEAALKAYTVVSGAQLLYETALTAGRRSSEVKGRLGSDSALQALLAGSGLTGRRTDVDAFIIVPVPAEQAGGSLPVVAPDARFLGALQTGVVDALCRNPQTRPGAYRIALELWVAPSGRVQRAGLIGSTGDGVRDAALISALQSATIPLAPPSGVPQPFVLAIASRTPADTGDCGGR